MKKLTSVTMIVLVIIGFSVVSSVAGVKKIWPGQLIPEKSTDSYFQRVDLVHPIDDSAIYFYAQVKLPLGKKVTKLSLYYEDYADTLTQAALFRAKFGEEREILAIAASIDSSTGETLIADDDSIDFKKITKGYTYWVGAWASNSNGHIKGITITYK